MKKIYLLICMMITIGLSYGQIPGGILNDGTSPDNSNNTNLVNTIGPGNIMSSNNNQGGTDNPLLNPDYYNYNTTGSANSFPWNIAAGKKVQILYLPGDFNQPTPAPAGIITALSFRIHDSYPLGPWTYTDLTIKLGQSTITSFTSGSFYSGSLTTVYYRASVSLTGTAGQWMTITLDSPFSYDPTQSLIVDLGQCAVPGATGYSSSFTTLSGNRRTWSVGGCPFVYSSVNAAVYHLGLTMATGTLPPTVVTTAATNVTTTGATLNGTVNANGSSTTVTFQYGLTPAYGSTITATQSPVTGNTVTPVSGPITGLFSNTLYHFRVVGVNVNGTSYGNDMTFTTVAAPPTVVTTAATAITTTGATLNGTVNANGSSTTVTFEYGQTTGYGSTITATQSPVTGNLVTAVSGPVTGLAPNTLYHFRVVGTNVAGTSNGNDMTFTTAAAPPLITTVAATFVGLTYATLNGTGNANNSNSTLSFEYGITPAYGSTAAGVPPTISGNTTTDFNATISGLIGNTTYYYRAKGVNAGGTTYGSQMTFFTTCLTPPTPGPISGPSGVCKGDTGYVYSVQPVQYAFVYLWNFPAGFTITSYPNSNVVTVNVSNTAVSGTITVRAQSDCGNISPPSNFSVTVNNLPTPAVTGNSPVCQYVNNTYTTEAGMTNYIWTVTPDGTITSTSDPNIVTISWSNTGSKTVGVVYTNPSTGCTAAAPGTLPVTVNAAPVPTISGSANLCVNSGFYNYTTETGQTNYLWTISSGGTITWGQGSAQIEVTWNVPGAQYVTVNYNDANNCPALNPTVLNVSVEGPPGAAGAITGTSDVCAGSTGIAYSVAPIVNTMTYVWSLPAGATIASGSGTNSITVDFAANAISGVITVYGNSICGNGTVSPDFPVTVTNIPDAAGTIAGPSSVCAGSAGEAYSVPTIIGATGYNWTLPTGATIASGANTQNITVDFSVDAVSGIITVAGTNFCGTGPVSPNFDVTVIPKPAAPVITVDELILTSNYTEGNQWFYNGVPITGGTAQTQLAQYTGWYWDIVTVNGCESDTSNNIYVDITAIGEPLNSQFVIYPVPNDGFFALQMLTQKEEFFDVNVYNSIGVSIYTKKDVGVKGQTDLTIDLRPIPTGIYTLVLRDNQHRIIRKIIVNK